VALRQALFIVSGVAFHHNIIFYNLSFTLRWLIQQCLSAQHIWLPITPLCKPFVDSSPADPAMPISPDTFWLAQTLVGIPLGIAPGWWDDRKRIHKPVLPIYLRLDIFSSQSQPCTFLPSPIWP
jgi:hypothetical protein